VETSVIRSRLQRWGTYPAPPAIRDIHTVARTSSMRVGLTVPGGFELGGIGRAMLYLTEAWKDIPTAPQWTLLDPRGRMSIGALAPLYLSREILRVAMSSSIGRLDLLHLNVAGRLSTVRKLLLSEASERIGLPTVVHLHDFEYRSDFVIRHPSMRDRVVRMFRRACLVLVLGHRDLKTAVELLGCDPWRVVVLPNAVPDPGYPQSRPEMTQPVKILFLGHLETRKGIFDLLDALDAEEVRRRSWKLTMAGGGDLDRFEAEIRRRGLTERIELTGWLPHGEAYQLLRQSDLFVLPSYAEGMALSMLEAMAHGKAIITTPVGAHTEAVTDGKEALLVPVGCRRSLVAALIRLIDDPQFRAQLGGAARERYIERFSLSSYATRMINLYELALSDLNRNHASKLVPMSTT
jgi:glycosyltransferase involved in cell wall biosynthesis